MIPFAPKTTGMIPFTPGKLPVVNTPAPQGRNLAQSIAGAVLDPVAKLATEAGQGIGVGLVKGADFLSGGKLGKMKTFNGKTVNENLDTAVATPSRVPGLGTEVKPIKDVGVKDVAGQALGVAGLATGNPMLGGSLIMGGNSLEQGGTPADIFYSGLGGAIFGKITDLGIQKATPFIQKSLEKYGTPLFDKIASQIPAGVKDAFKAFAEKAPLEKVTVPNAPKGNFVNIGLNTNVGGKITEKDVLNALPKDVKVISSATHPSGTEPTFVGELSRPLTQDEHYALTRSLNQDAIPQMSNGKGTMTNVGAKSWGKFNPEYFMDMTGNTLGATPKTPSVLDKFQAGASKVDAKISGTVKNASNKVGITTPEPTADQKIADLISPKPTAKEAKLAEMQGRLYKGKESTLFKGETPDRIATSNEQLAQVQTIKKLIPGAEKMDEPTLYDTIKDNINKTATKLKPELEKTPTKFETVKKMQDDWATIKDKQMKDAPATEEKNVLKRQTQFEAIIKKVASKSNGNLDDIWTVAKEYDRTIPDAVKKANSLSSESLQARKVEWLQNRRIFKTALNDTKNGLGETSRVAFEDMTNMYESQQSILTNAEVNTKLKGSKLSEFGDTTGGKLLKGALGGAGILETTKKVFTGSF
jgi:hypothetical protein